ncbi:hypothetical protein-signal peptide and transmembrane prediction [Rhodopirellula baltica SH 1]|uniref:Uncharacterized protein n=1 Tax=Rhodopirellula baltica (strain DSM 10527 / NCIMB 13988 / SH1) TaxID=243090 RepID=Q7UMX6_RHOBA|nr:hypothetical protein-signal peptide and transmembrane prediction [Rhodopirellula baltica SH 1]
MHDGCVVIRRVAVGAVVRVVVGVAVAAMAIAAVPVAAAEATVAGCDCFFGIHFVFTVVEQRFDISQPEFHVVSRSFGDVLDVGGVVAFGGGQASEQVVVSFHGGADQAEGHGHCSGDQSSFGHRSVSRKFVLRRCKKVASEFAASFAVVRLVTERLSGGGPKLLLEKTNLFLKHRICNNLTADSLGKHRPHACVILSSF